MPVYFVAVIAATMAIVVPVIFRPAALQTILKK
jgi:hypothetical protein